MFTYIYIYINSHVNLIIALLFLVYAVLNNHIKISKLKVE